MLSYVGVHAQLPLLEVQPYCACIGNASQLGPLSHQPASQLCSSSHVFHVSSIPCLIYSCLIYSCLIYSCLMYSVSHLFCVSSCLIPYLFHVLAQTVSQPSGGSGRVSTFRSCLKSCLDFKPRLAIGCA